MPLSTASILYAFLLLVGAAATSLPAGDGEANTTMLTNVSATSSSHDDTETYICYLCTGRNPLLMRYCPIYWDDCHLICYADVVAPASTAPPSLGLTADAINNGVRDEECYIMKLYRNGSYVIVARLGCAEVARCLLSCGGGDMADRRDALGAANPVPATTAAIQRSVPYPRVTDFQRCGTQVNAIGGSLGTERRPRPGWYAATPLGRF